MTATTIIPDIHADPARLDASLAAAEGKRIAFLGDLIDAGSKVGQPDDGYVLEKARDLVESGRALAIMGNHELNAILFHTFNTKGEPLRKHSQEHIAQHKSFIDRFGSTSEVKAWTDWFLTLPLWLEVDGLRLVHACWDQDAIDTIAKRRPDGRLTADDLEEVADKEKPTAFAAAVEMLTSGPEVPLPNGHSFHDSKGKNREKVRIAWWRAATGTWREVALSVPDLEELPDEPIAGTESLSIYPESSPPVLFGHYKIWDTPRIDHSHASCLDFPDAPCVYHWSGGKMLDSKGLEVLST